MIDINTIPKEIVGNRNQIECNFIFALWQRPDDIEVYKNIENGKDIITEDGIFYYGVLKQLYKLGYENFDSATLYTFFSDKDELRHGYERRGGYSTIDEIKSLIQSENLESYYDELVKNNMLVNLYNSGFNIIKDIGKLREMTSDEVYDYYDYLLNNMCVGKVEKLKAENLSDGYSSYITEWDKGRMVGFRIGYPILNYRLAGVHKKNLLLHMAHIGNGKTTSSILFYILPAIESGENVCIIANEQGISEFRQMILASVVFNKINYRKMNRQKFIRGGFSDDDKAAMLEGEKWLRECDGKIIFIETSDYNIGTVKKIVKKYSKLNYGLFIFDTLKPAVESSDRAWAEFSEVAKELFVLAKNEDVAIVATAQLSSESMSRRYLDLSCVGKSRAIAETATQVVMFRSLTTEEKNGGIKVYEMKRNENGKYMDEKIYKDLDPNKDYVVLFTPKNRFGDTKPQIVYERNMSFNTMREIGYTEVGFDGFHR